MAYDLATWGTTLSQMSLFYSVITRYPRLLSKQIFPYVKYVYKMPYRQGGLPDVRANAFYASSFTQAIQRVNWDALPYPYYSNSLLLFN